MALPDASTPPALTVELTNVCNLKCTYCTSRLNLRSRGMMSEATFDRLVEDVREFAIPRVRFVGNGDATLHPCFGAFMRRMAAVAPFVSVVTHGQNLTNGTVEAVLEAPVRLIEISVDGMDAETYERSRVGGHFGRLLDNLRHLKRRRDATRAPVLINIRLMIRPSLREQYAELVHFWRPFADCVMGQYVLKRPEIHDDPDVFENVQRPEGWFPRCTLPFKDLPVTWNGNVPLCQQSAHQIGEPGLLLGNVNRHRIAELWNCPTMRQYRRAHRLRDTAAMPVCKGCGGI